MPLVRIDLPAQTAATTRRAPDEIICSAEFVGITHSDQMFIVQITLAPRSVELKKKLFQDIASGIAQLA